VSQADRSIYPTPSSSTNGSHNQAWAKRKNHMHSVPPADKQTKKSL
jgi:hypothetical protein